MSVEVETCGGSSRDGYLVGAVGEPVWAHCSACDHLESPLLLGVMMPIHAPHRIPIKQEKQQCETFIQ